MLTLLLLYCVRTYYLKGSKYSLWKLEYFKSIRLYPPVVVYHATNHHRPPLYRGQHENKAFLFHNTRQNDVIVLSMIMWSVLMPEGPAHHSNCTFSHDKQNANACQVPPRTRMCRREGGRKGKVKKKTTLNPTSRPSGFHRLPNMPVTPAKAGGKGPTTEETCNYIMYRRHALQRKGKYHHLPRKHPQIVCCGNET